MSLNFAYLDTTIAHISCLWGVVDGKQVVSVFRVNPAEPSTDQIFSVRTHQNKYSLSASLMLLSQLDWFVYLIFDVMTWICDEFWSVLKVSSKNFFDAKHRTSSQPVSLFLSSRQLQRRNLVFTCSWQHCDAPVWGAYWFSCSLSGVWNLMPQADGEHFSTLPWF